MHRDILANHRFHALFHQPFALTEFPPTKRLTQQIRRRDWDGARFRILTYPWDAHYKTRSGNNSTPLHLVCLYRAPLFVVELLVDANPKALLAQDTEGWTPLHLVLLYGGEDDICLLLIRRGGAAAASMQSRFVGSPLHLACRHGASLTILKELLAVNMSMATTANETGTKPAAFVWNEFVRNPGNGKILQHMRQLFGGIQVQDGMDDEDYRNVEELLKRISLLLQAAKQEDPEGPLHLIHDLVSHQSSLGDINHFLALAIELYPQQVQTWNDTGDYPLHIAASNPPLARPRFSCARAFLDPHRDSVDLLVQSFPDAARITNRYGHLPIQLALREGRRTWWTGVASLIEAESDTLLIRDSMTRLYPFQLAAAFPAKEEVDSVGTILELLLACPHALLCSN